MVISLKYRSKIRTTYCEIEAELALMCDAPSDPFRAEKRLSIQVPPYSLLLPWNSSNSSHKKFVVRSAEKKKDCNRGRIGIRPSFDPLPEEYCQGCPQRNCLE